MAKKGSSQSSSYKYTSISTDPKNVPDPYKAKTYKKNTYKGTYKPGQYTSEYTNQINASRDNLVNWKYDPLSDANYQALAAVYGARGDLAAKNSLADAASLNGGYGTSYATSAAQQARNQYNQELASMIPQLEETAYNRAMGTYNVLMDADNTAYGRFRDTEGDRQWAANYGLDVFNTNEASRQWAAGMNQAERQFGANYGLDRAQLLTNYSQWAQDYNSDWYKWNQEQQKAAASGGGRSGGGGGYSSGSSSAYTPTDTMPITPEDIENLKKKNKSGGSSGHGTSINKKTLMTM